MVLTPSTMLALGTPAPDFELRDVVSGELRRLSDFADKQALVVMFLCKHCPFVKHVAEGVARFGRDYAELDVALVAISANDPETHPEDRPEELAADARRHAYPFPVLFDATQEVAKAYTAACTPDFFVFDAERRLVYRGQLDASRPGNGVPVTAADLRAAVDAVLAGRPVSPDQKPSLGCNIKWRPGNKPEYYRS